LQNLHQKQEPPPLVVNFAFGGDTVTSVEICICNTSTKRSPNLAPFVKKTKVEMVEVVEVL
jgi:hypothetical protein